MYVTVIYMRLRAFVDPVVPVGDLCTENPAAPLGDFCMGSLFGEDFDFVHLLC
jgi:hypothetical protein